MRSLRIPLDRAWTAAGGDCRKWHFGNQQRFLAALEVAPFDDTAAELSGSLRAWLATQGTPIGPYDTLIAAHAHAIGAVLVSNNTREFERVPGLKLENWARGA